MARDKGLLNISANFEPQTAQPFDARMRAQTLADLTNATQWKANDGTVYAYIGMITVVYNDTINNGLYRLEQEDYTNISNWAKVGDGGTAGSVDWSNIEGDITQNADLRDSLSLKEDTANKNQANGYVGLDANAKIDIAYIPSSALERLIIVADEVARFALTPTTAQNGDIVKQQDTDVMFYIVDDTNLSNATGYEEFAVGTAGAVEWSNILNKPTDILYEVSTDGTLLGTGTSSDLLSVPDLFKYERTTLPTGNNLIDTIDGTVHYVMKLEYHMYSSNTYRTGVVKVLTDGITHTISDNVDGEIGNTSAITFTASMSGTDCNVYVTNSSATSYTIKFTMQLIGY